MTCAKMVSHVVTADGVIHLSVVVLTAWNGTTRIAVQCSSYRLLDPASHSLASCLIRWPVVGTDIGVSQCWLSEFE